MLALIFTVDSYFDGPNKPVVLRGCVPGIKSPVKNAKTNFHSKK